MSSQVPVYSLTTPSQHPVIAIVGADGATGVVTSVDGETGDVDLTGTYVRVFDIRQYGGLIDGTTDEASFIQAAMTAAAATVTGGVVLIPAANAKVVLVGATLIHPSGVELRLDPGVTLRRKPGFNGNLIVNAAIAAGAGRDSNIALTGGIGSHIEGNNNAAAVSGSLHVRYEHVDRLRVQGLKFTTTNGKYALRVSDVDKFKIADLDFQTNSDGVHVTGPASRGEIMNITGTTADDIVALCCSEGTYPYPPNFAPLGGDISYVTIAGVYPTNALNALKIMGATGYKLRNITARDFYGTVTSYGANITDDTAGATVIEGLVMEKWGIVNPAANPTFTINGSAMRDITIRDVDNKPLGSANVVQLGSAAVLKRLVLDNIRALGALGQVWILSSAGTLDGLTLKNIQQINTGGSGGIVLITGGHVKRVQASGIHTESGGQVFRSTVANANVCQISCSDVTAFITGSLVATLSPMVLTLAAVYCDAFNNMFQLTGASASLRVTGSLTGLRAATPGVSRDSTQTVSINGVNIPADVAILTPQDGDMVTNTNAALACGTGPVVYNTAAAKWKHLYTGVTT